MTSALGFTDLASYAMEVTQKGASTASHSRKKAYWVSIWTWTKALSPSLLMVSSSDWPSKMMHCEEGQSGQLSRYSTQVGAH